MISDALIKKIKKIEIKTGRVIEEIFSGNYRSAFKGNGMEFEEIREYYALSEQLVHIGSFRAIKNDIVGQPLACKKHF